MSEVYLEKSVEEQAEDLVKSLLQKSNIRYYAKNESINEDIDKALSKGISKFGGKGGNYPDIKMLTKNEIPMMIELKGSFDSLLKFSLNSSERAFIDYTTSEKVQAFALNGAMHYTDVILNNTDYPYAYAVGITGFYYPLSNEEKDSNGRRKVHIRGCILKMTREQKNYNSSDVIKSFTI